MMSRFDFDEVINELCKALNVAERLKTIGTDDMESFLMNKQKLDLLILGARISAMENLIIALFPEQKIELSEMFLEEYGLLLAAVKPKSKEGEK